MKKILFCQPTLNYTGSEKSLLEILKGLNDIEEFKTYVFGGEKGGIIKEYEKYTQQVFITNSKKLNKNLISIIPFLKSFYSVYKDLKKTNEKENFDLVYVNTLMFPQAVIASKLLGIKSIVHIRETDERYPKFIYKFYFLVSLFFSKKIVVVSKRILNQNFPFNKKFLEKTQVIYNSSSMTNKRYNKILQNPFNLLSVIPVSEKKGIYELIYFCRDLKKLVEGSNIDFCLNIVGNNEDKILYTDIKKIINEFDLVGNIKFHGEKSDMTKYYSEADILIHPSPNESFGRVLIEAMNYSTPTISFNNGGAIEIIKDGESGYIIENKNFNMMAEKTFKLLNSPELYMRFSKKSYALYNQKFSLHKLTKDTYNLLKNT